MKQLAGARTCGDSWVGVSPLVRSSSTYNSLTYGPLQDREERSTVGGGIAAVDRRVGGGDSGAC